MNLLKMPRARKESAPDDKKRKNIGFKNNNRIALFKKDMKKISSLIKGTLIAVFFFVPAVFADMEIYFVGVPLRGDIIYIVLLRTSDYRLKQ